MHTRVRGAVLATRTAGLRSRLKKIPKSKATIQQALAHRTDRLAACSKWASCAAAAASLVLLLALVVLHEVLPSKVNEKEGERSADCH